jgi:ComF family protein
MNLTKSDFIERYRWGIKRLHKALYRFIFPASYECGLCGGEGEIICKKCIGEIQKHSGVLCDKCGRAVRYEGLCEECIKNPRPYERGAIVFFYEGRAQQAMKDFKFENMLPYGTFFAQELYEKIKPLGWDIDIVTAVPSHPYKIIGKGYNAPAVIARRLSRMMNLKYDAGLLKRIRHTKSVSLMHGIDRMAHAKENFAIKKPGLDGKNILLIDDVSTTGSTLHVCTQILKNHGAGKVYVAAACGDVSKDWYGESAKGIV